MMLPTWRFTVEITRLPLDQVLTIDIRLDGQFSFSARNYLPNDHDVLASVFGELFLVYHSVFGLNWLLLLLVLLVLLHVFGFEKWFNFVSARRRAKALLQEVLSEQSGV